MKEKSNIQKHKEGRCKGEGLDYVPWIKANEFSSTGSSYVAYNYKTKRQVHLLANSEALVFFCLLWDDDVSDIKEQYVLDLDETKEIAELLGVRKPAKEMSTDFIFNLKDDFYTHGAISVKASRRQAEVKRTKELLRIEEEYWHRRGYFYQVIYADDINPIYVKNIRIVTRIHEPSLIQTDTDAIKYLILKGHVQVDMDRDLSFPRLLKQYKKEVDALYEFLKEDHKRLWDRACLTTTR